jgi:hypothetical protein
MRDFPEIVRNYLAVWNETDPTQRAKLIRQVFAPDATYTDPLADVSGHDALSGLVEAVQGQFKGMVFSTGDPVEAHHNIGRFTWHLGQGGAAEPPVIGFDVITVDDEGKINVTDQVVVGGSA